MEETVKERLIRFYQSKGMSKSEFERACGLSNGYINQLRHQPSSAKLESIYLRFPDLNRIWLLTGEGNMIEENIAPNGEIFKQEHGKAQVPFISQYAYAGYLTGYGDNEYLESLPTIDFTPDRTMSGNYIAIEVKGDSMDDGSKDSYESGEILVCREVMPHLWKDSKLHINRRDFVIIHKDGILIKRIIAHDVEKHLITIHSLNPLYEDRVIDLADVMKIFSVIESRKQRAR